MFLYFFAVRGVGRRIFRFYQLKKKAIFSVHSAPDFNRRHLSTFESHDPATMRKLRIPCDKVMTAFVASDGHDLLVTGCWSLAVEPGYELRVAACPPSSA